MGGNGSDRDLKVTVARVALVGLWLVLSVRLFSLQVIRGSYYLGLADSNRVKLSVIRAPRGLILDRAGRVVAQDRAASAIVLDPAYGSDSANVAAVAALVGMDQEEVRRRIAVALRRRDLCVLDPDATFAVVSRIEERRDVLKGTGRRLALRRRYPLGEAVGCLVGYMGEVSEAELGKDSGYRMGDMIGRTGLERQYEAVLRGQNGWEFVQVDAMGRELGTLPERSAIQPRPGRDLVISVDSGLQALAWDLIGPHRQGAVVAIDPRSGDVLAMVSRPSFDPNVLGSGIGRTLWASLNADTLFPLLNRAIQCTYPPGSTFKLLTAAAALEERAITPSDRRVCVGSYPYGNRAFKCWKEGGHGTVDLRRAIVESCDVYFYSVGLTLGVDRLARWAHAVGFGRATGIDLGNEKPGFFPTTQWYDRVYGRGGWSKGAALNLAIGQGEVLVTPLQLACFFGALGNDGIMFVPRLGVEVRDPVTKRRTPIQLPRGRRLPLSRRTLDLLQDALTGVVQDPGGTGWRARVPGVRVAGKTGTAQNPHGEDHAWFVGYAPADRPIIAVCAMVERGGGGGAQAAPIVGAVIQAWLTAQGFIPRPEGA